MLTIQSDLRSFRRLRFSCDSRFLSITDGDTPNGEEGYEIWHVPPESRPTYRASKTVLRGMEWHPTKAELYVPHDLVLDIVDPDGNLLQTLPDMGWVEGVVFSSMGEWLVTYSPFHLRALQRKKDQWHQIWAVEHSTEQLSPSDSNSFVASFPDSRRLIALVGRRFLSPHINWTHLFVQRDMTTGAVLAERPLAMKESPVGVRNRLAVAPDGMAVVGFRGRSVYVWPTDAAPGTRKTTVAKKDLWDVALHPSGRWVATVCNNSEVSICDLNAGKVVQVFDWGIKNLQCVTFSPDGSLAAAGGANGEVAVWDWDL